MSKQGRILVVDDMEVWREELVETLQRSGFYANAAGTIAQALERLNETFYHILILDLRLDETNYSNADGIDLLGKLEEFGLNEPMKVIILSAHGTREQMRDAFRDYKIVDFLFKDDFNTRSFLQNVKRVLAREVKINLQLSIMWQKIGTPERVVVNTLVGGSRIKDGTPQQHRIMVELEDLFCRLFYQAESILVQPLTPGKSGAGVLWVQPFYSTGGGRTVIVKFGDYHKIEEEHHNFKDFVEPFVGGGRNTTIFNVSRTPHLGGIVYSLLGASNDQLEDFGSFYSRASTSQVKEALDRLFLDTCRAWYANPGRLQPHNLTEDYQQLFSLTQEKLEKALEMLKSVQGKQNLHFNQLNSQRTFTNPVLATNNLKLVWPTYVCVTHGDFNQNNILVDSGRNTWLIDFQMTGRGHFLRDVAKLDSEVRFQLLMAEEATLEERLWMEEALCSIGHFSQIEQLEHCFSTENQALAKAYATAIHLRYLAGKLVSRNPGDDMGEYHVALIYNALNTVRFYSLPARQREHALLSASLLVDRLGLKV